MADRHSNSGAQIPGVLLGKRHDSPANQIINHHVRGNQRHLPICFAPATLLSTPKNNKLNTPELISEQLFVTLSTVKWNLSKLSAKPTNVLALEGTVNVTEN